MTNIFSEVSPERCAHYAKFFQYLTVAEANLIFWSLFFFVLVLMCTASIIHHKSIALTEASKKLPKEIAQSPEHVIAMRRVRVKYLSLVSLCACFSATSAVLECFAAFNIEYCAGEDLMNLYWGFWSILQVGSNIAILGVMLQFWIVLGDVETPSWAVALGTPVLVFAALGFVLKEVWKKTWSRCLSEKPSQLDDDKSPIISSLDNEEKGVEFPVNQSTTTIPLCQVEKKRNSFWSRDLHYLMSSIVTENPLHHREYLGRIPEGSPAGLNLGVPRIDVRKQHISSQF